MAQLLRLTPDRCDAECLHPATVRPLLDRTLEAGSVQATADWFAMLADPTRLRILQALSLTHELCAHDLALVLGLSVSALSHQLRLLRERGVVTRRKAGRIAYFRLADDHVRHVLSDALAHSSEGGVPDGAAVDGERIVHTVAGHRRRGHGAAS